MNGAGAAAAAAAAIAQAIKASGVLVSLAPEEFEQLLPRLHEPLIVYAEGGWFSTRYSYLTSYKGLAFFTKSKEPLALPRDAEVVVAKGIWMP